MIQLKYNYRENLLSGLVYDSHFIPNLYGKNKTKTFPSGFGESSKKSSCLVFQHNNIELYGISIYLGYLAKFTYPHPLHIPWADVTTLSG